MKVKRILGGEKGEGKKGGKEKRMKKKRIHR